MVKQGSGTISDSNDALNMGSFNIGKNANSAFNGMISNVRMVQRNRTLHDRLHTTNSTTHKCNQHKTSVLSVKYFC